MIKGRLKSATAADDGSVDLIVNVDGRDCVLSVPPNGLEQLASRGLIHLGEGRLADGYAGETFEARVSITWRCGGQGGRGGTVEDRRWYGG